MDAVTELQHYLTALQGEPSRDLNLHELGDLHIALRSAMAEVEEKLAPLIARGADRGMTYVELASAAGYGSTTTITKIMKAQGASPGRGPKPFRHL